MTTLRAIEGAPTLPASGPELPAEDTMNMSSWSQTKRSAASAEPSEMIGTVSP